MISEVISAMLWLLLPKSMHVDPSFAISLGDRNDTILIMTSCDRDVIIVVAVAIAVVVNDITLFPIS